MAVQSVSKKDFKAKVLESKLPVLVDFYAEWCSPCKLSEPVLDELAGEYRGKLIIVKVNVDEETELAKEYKVMSIPTVVAMKSGKEIERKMGFAGKAGFEEMIKKII